MWKNPFFSFFLKKNATENMRNFRLKCKLLNLQNIPSNNTFQIQVINMNLKQNLKNKEAKFH